MNPNALLFALALAAQEPAAPAAPPAPYAQLETMRRMLHRQIESRRGAILGAPDARASRRATSFRPDPSRVTLRAGEYGPVTDALLDVYATAAISRSQAEYVPGLAAIFSLKVPVRTEWADDPKPEDAGTPAAAASSDDEAWEAVARGEAKGDGRGYVGWVQSLSSQRPRDRAARRLRFNAEAIDALRSTILDTMWRFGHRLELGRGERLAVVVEVEAAPRARTAVSYSDAPVDPAGATFDPATLPSVTDFDGAGDLDLFLAGAPGAVAPPPFRLVFQVSADDLTARRSAAPGQDGKFAGRISVQAFAMAAPEVNSPPSAGSR